MDDVRKALISVSDKTGVVEFAKGLIALGYEVISTGGTLATLAEAGAPARKVSEVTGVPEILGGRVKTLHPVIFGGILARREMSEDLETLREHGIAQIDVVAVNLYPFEKTAAKPGAKDEEIIEQIDIGGPSLLRAAAKNHQNLYPVVDPSDYPEVLRVLGEKRDADGRAFRRRLSAKVFDHCSRYDRAIASYLSNEAAPEENSTAKLPDRLEISWPVKQHLRYGENPHQAAAFYTDPLYPPPSLATARQLQGKELSYNNYLDGEAALEMAREFTEPAAVILKHANPCGVGRGKSIEEAYRRALECDPVSAFGGIVGFNRPVDVATAQAMSELFLEVVIAPSFDADAAAVFAKKKNLRLLETGPFTPRVMGLTYRGIPGGLLVQEADISITPREAAKVVSKAQPTDADWDALFFAWKVVRWVRSNAIVYTSAQRTLGIGAGQMSRIDSAKFGIQKAEEHSPGALKGAFLASDGFFPFRDVVDLVAKSGIRAIIQPGGSVRDEESFAAADEHGIIMVLTGQRHFRH